MKNSFGAVFAIVATSSVVLADGLTVHPYETVTNFVAEGEEQTSGDLYVATEGNLLKTGAGEWKVPYGASDQLQPLAVTVLDGTFSSTAATRTVPAATEPAFLRTDSSLLLWLDAGDSDSTHFQTKDGGSATGVDIWHDVRETDADSPTRNYAKANYNHTENPPERVTTNGYKAVWFGGYTSGRYCTFCKADGSAFPVNNSAYYFKHVFAVHGVLESYGNIFGSTSGSASSYVSCWYASSKPASLTQTYLWDSQWNDVSSGRLYVNGERTDLSTIVRTGFQIFEATTGILKYSYVTSIFSRGSNAVNAGGDFLCEVLAFNRDLTEDERIAVETYLTRKWFPNRAAPLREIRLNNDAVARVEDGSKFKISSKGLGTVVKTGAEANVVYDPDVPETVLDIRSGTVKSLVAVPIRAAAGDTVSASITTCGTQLGIEHSAGAGELVKTGSAEAILTGVPSGVKTIEVRQGGIFFRAPVTNEAFDAMAPVTVPIYSANFDDIPAESMPGGVKNISADFCGWRQIDGNASFVYDYDVWTDKVSGQADTATPAAWEVKRVRPPSGSRAMMVRGNGVCCTTVSIPSAGTYELSFKACARHTMGTYNGIKVSFTDVNNVEKALAGMLRRMDGDSDLFRQYHWRVRLDSPGDYRIQLAGQNNGSAIMFDDFALVRVPDVPFSRYQVPGGTFEAADINLSYYSIFTNIHTQSGWTLTDQDGWTDSKGRPSIGLGTPAMGGTYRTGGFANFSREYDGGLVTLAMRGKGGDTGARASTTFTPPAGTYRLAAQTVKYGQYARSAEARVTIGGETVSLGSVTASGKLFSRSVWPVAFTTDGSTPVTLTLFLDAITETYADYGMILDDFELVTDTASTVELVKNGGFDSYSGWPAIPAGTGFTSTWVARNYSEAHWAFGYEPDGTDGKFTAIYGYGGITQAIALSGGVRYRVSLISLGRVNKDWTYRPHPLSVSFAKDGVTNVIGRIVSSDIATKTFEANHHRYAFDFTPPSSGTYTLVLRGEWTDDYHTCSEINLDDVSVKAVDGKRDLTPPFAPDTRIRIASGATMTVDFEGTNRIAGLRLGGHAVTGIVSPTTHPEYLMGSGTFDVVPNGMVLMVR